jgi:F-type H+-transporting ATPase subunit delta
VLARNGRKGQLAQVTRLFRRLAAEHRGEATAEVVSAHPLSDDQVATLKSKLKARAGRDVTIDTLTDPQILGGLIVKLGSEMIDASLKSKLNRLAQAMKG